MHNLTRVLKVLTVVLAVLAVGVFVSYRAGAFDKHFSPATAEPEPQPPTLESAVDTAPSTDSAAQTDLLLMSTSKSAGVLIPPKKSPPKSEAKQQILPGSKSLAPLIPPKQSSSEPK